MSAYLVRHPDIAAIGADPFSHYLNSGFYENRLSDLSNRAIEVAAHTLFDERYYLSQFAKNERPDNPLAHYLAIGWRFGKEPSRAFNGVYYRDTNDLDLNDWPSPLHHYLKLGQANGLQASLMASILGGVPSCAPEERLGYISLVEHLFERQPQFEAKWGLDYYLCWAMARNDRRKAMLHHYKFLLGHLHAEPLHDIIAHGRRLWISDGFGPTFSVELRFAEPVYWEGEMSMVFRSGPDVLYTLSFSITPGECVGSEHETAILTTRLQGAPGRYADLRAASKALKEVSAVYVLYACLEGFAAALGIGGVAGVAAEHHPARPHTPIEALRPLYDDLFQTLGLHQTSEGLFTGQFGLEDKPLSEIKAGHRRRTKAKRQLRAEITEASRAVTIAMMRPEVVTGAAPSVQASPVHMEAKGSSLAPFQAHTAPSPKREFAMNEV